jgi:hypothetical protein
MSAFFVFGTTIAVIYWWVAGSLLIGEKADLSPRVRRRLPQSFVGRAFLTWLNPGSGTGYFFTLLNLGAMLFAFAALESTFHYLNLRNRGWGMNVDDAWTFALAAWLMVASYLGVGRLLVMLVRNRVPSGPVFSFLLQVVLITFGTLIPLVLQLAIVGPQNFEYSPLQVTNPFWTLAEMMFDWSTVVGGTAGSLLILIIFGGGMVVVHFISTIREVEQTRLAAPTRVLEEDAAAIAARTPVRKKNPWDDPPGASPAPALASSETR